MTHPRACQLAAAILTRMADVHEADERKSSVKDAERSKCIAQLREIAETLLAPEPERIETT